jgi:hypothetical protein
MIEDLFDSYEEILEDVEEEISEDELIEFVLDN